MHGAFADARSFCKVFRNMISLASAQELRGHCWRSQASKARPTDISVLATADAHKPMRTGLATDRRRAATIIGAKAVSSFS